MKLNVPVSGNAVVLSAETTTPAPPEGAGPLSVSVTVARCPDCTVDGLMDMPLIVTGAGGGVTVTLANFTTPPQPASDETVVDELTVPAVTLKFADV